MSLEVAIEGMGIQITKLISSLENTTGVAMSIYMKPVRATLPPSMLFADSVLLYRGYTISVPKA